MGLLILILGLIAFLGAHTFVTARTARASAMARLGKAYWLAFAITSLIGVILIAWGFSIYRQTGWINVWSPPAFMRHITVGLMLIASLLLAAYWIPSHIKARVQHPLLAATKTWSFAHLLANGDLGSIILFGTLLAWAVYAFVRAKHRKDVVLPSAPLGWTNDLFVVVVGVALFLALGYLFHPYVIGVPVFG